MTTPTRTRKTKIDELDETVVNESLTRQVAAFLLSNNSIPACARFLALSTSTVRAITLLPRYKEIIHDLSEKELGPILTKAKTSLARLAPKSIRVLERAMDDYLEGKGNAREAIAASNTALKAVGLNEEQEKQSETQITVVLPGGVEPKTFEVNNED